MYTLEPFISRFGHLFESYFEHLVGATVESIGEPYIDRNYVAGKIEVGEGTILTTHFRAATPTEITMKQEIPADDDLTFDDLYFGNILGQTIQRIEAKADHESQEAYLHFYFSKFMYFEVPIGYSSKTGELYGYAKELLSDEEWGNFTIH